MTPTPSLPPEDADVALTRLAQFIGRAVGVPGDLDALAYLSKLKEALQKAERERDEERRLRLISVKPSYEALFFRTEAAEAREKVLREALVSIRDISGNHKAAQMFAANALATDPGATE